MPLAISATVLQIVTPNQLRAQVSAVYMLFLNLITALIVTTGIGFITDFWFKNEMALGQSITMVNLLSMFLAFCAYTLQCQTLIKNSQSPKKSVSIKGRLVENKQG